jgi:hypothetical protein
MMSAPGDTTLLDASFPTTVFQTPPNSGPPPPYVQPKAQIHSANGDNPLPPDIQPTLDPGSLNVSSGSRTPTNQRVPPGSSGVGCSASSSESSFLTPGNFYSTHIKMLRFLLLRHPTYPQKTRNYILNLSGLCCCISAGYVYIVCT